MIRYHDLGETRLNRNFETIPVLQALESELKEQVPGSENLWPTRRRNELRGITAYWGAMVDHGNGFYSFNMFNQLPGMPDEIVPEWCGHYSVMFNPQTGEILYRLFGDYGGLTWYKELDGDWEVPKNQVLCTYLRKNCAVSWLGAYRTKYIKLSVENGVVTFRSSAPVNIHTGESYRNCQLLITER